MRALAISQNFRSYIISIAAAILFIKFVFLIEKFKPYFNSTETLSNSFLLLVSIGIVLSTVVYISIFYFMDLIFLHHSFKGYLTDHSLSRIKVLGFFISLNPFMQAYTRGVLDTLTVEVNMDYWLSIVIEFNYLTFAAGLFLMALSATIKVR
tara:strand:+ start:85296 stop:85751 length:456 start_codon:yes stop_codon:yes gene_type:complete